MKSYDVIVVGGRVAGSTLAIRLGMLGLTVLLLERDRLPSLPAASSPIIYAPSMALLDELGVYENAYAYNTPLIRKWVIEAHGIFRVEQSIPMESGRDYAYAVDRARFDFALWERAEQQPTVDVCQGCSVLDLLWEKDCVVGVVAKDVTSEETRVFRSSWVVGADGRFSVVSRKTGALVYDEHTLQPTSLYYAYWHGVSRYDCNEAVAHMVSTGGDYGLLLMDSANDTTLVAVEGRSDVVSPGRIGTETFYLDFLRQHPQIWDRLKTAERVTTVRGMKRIGNLYRRAGGSGWLLVGDALHQKDPLDGQGIYDALFMAKILAEQLGHWKSEKQSSDKIINDYEKAVYKETQPMYQVTLERVKREIYNHRPNWFMQTLARWLYEDPIYRQHWGLLFTRSIEPDRWFTYGVVIPAVLRGALRALKNKIFSYNKAML